MTIMIMVVLLIHLNVDNTVYACSPVAVENWWYTQEYTFDMRQIPPEVDVQIVYDHSSIGRFVFSNEGDDEWYVVLNNQVDSVSLLQLADDMPMDHHALLSHEISSERLQDIALGIPIDIDERWTRWSNQLSLIDPEPLSPWFNQHHPELFLPLDERHDNIDDAGGVTISPPAPRRSSMVFVNQNNFYAVPYTITYRISDQYDPNMIVPPTTIKNRTVAASAIVMGHAPAWLNPQIDQMFGRDMVIGRAVFEVDEWIKGSGPDLIQVDEFGFGPDCRPNLFVGRTVVLFLGEQYATDHYHLIETWGWYGEEIASKSDVTEIYQILDEQPQSVAHNDAPQPTLWRFFIMGILTVVAFASWGRLRLRSY